MKLLIVDDDEAMVHMLEKFFKIKGYDCTISFDGKNALDTILLDLAMPGFSGYDFIDDLEKTGKLHEQNIVVLTASSITSVQSDALLKRGIKSCLNKPVTAETLLHAISSLD